MTQNEIQNSLRGLHDEKQAYFAIKKINDGEDDIYIDANRNGILVFCNFLLESINKEHLEKENWYDIPDPFWDESDIVLSVKIQEGNKNRQEVKESFFSQAGCFLAIAVSAIVVLVGIVTSFIWLVEIFD
jgi:hypothetical protein